MEKIDFMKYALTLAKKSAEEGEVPVGAIVVCDGKIVGEGRNRREVVKNALHHAEIEAIACMEAFTCGVIPVISDHPKSATNQFALDERCLFNHGKANHLAEKIDYWFDNPDEKEKMSMQYIEYAKQFRVENSVRKIEAMFEDAILFYNNVYNNTAKK